ncbi:transcriptional regulator BetI [Sneathiella sp. P13V-1]|uniref:transcriptional regulator BetI n=1 Tax=Sneathiella sp. P13V-1 TaxID=2697366 RepID=UPI00187B80B7|nr:transcriptional regulator BetI [Sneathiella sp. P13V-1]MBE7638674.1 transcriptional regulator BetI [Sneathiella sp. P13V-1]
MPKVGMPKIRIPQLIEATMSVINDVGIHNASVAAIGKYASVSPAIINHYFGGKAGLLEATMRHVLKRLSNAINLRLKEAETADVADRVMAIIDGNFDPEQMDPRYTKTWLTFWCQAMHKPELYRLQQINNKRLLSYLRYEFKKHVSHEQAVFISHGVASLIDGIWLRSALSPSDFDHDHARSLILKFIEANLTKETWITAGFHKHI